MIDALILGLVRDALALFKTDAGRPFIMGSIAPTPDKDVNRQQEALDFFAAKDIQADYGWNQERSKALHIHMLIQNDEHDSEVGMGGDEGIIESGWVRDRKFAINLYLTSPNAMERAFLYETLLRYLYAAFYDPTTPMPGIHTWMINGRDWQLSGELAPEWQYTRILQITGSMQIHVPFINEKPTFSGYSFVSNPT